MADGGRAIKSRRGCSRFSFVFLELSVDKATR